MDCNTNDFMFPMQADVYYPIVDQGAYGNVQKRWVLDRTIICNFTGAGSGSNEDIKPNVNITQETLLVGRVKKDLRVSSIDAQNAMTNVIITNIRDKGCREIYLETVGPRAGKSTIFELATQEPYSGPFGDVEYYRVVLRRSENQASDV